MITEVTLQCESAFNVEEITEKSTLGNCLANLDHLKKNSEHVKIWVEPYSDFCDIYTFNRTDKEVQLSDQMWKIGVKVISVWGEVVEGGWIGGGGGGRRKMQYIQEKREIGGGVGGEATGKEL